MRRFATALVMTYLASHDRLSVCNAGHPRPLYYRASERTWSLLSQPASRWQTTPATCRWGSTKRRDYQTFDVELGRGDLVVFYTDALTEAADPTGKLLGEEGLLEAARRLDLSDSPAPARSARRSSKRSPAIAGIGSADDDVTLVVLHHNAVGDAPAVGRPEARRLRQGLRPEIGLTENR